MPVSKRYIEQKTRLFALYLKTFLKWMIYAILLGIVCGAVGTAFHYSVDFVTGFRLTHPWMLFLLPVAGLLIVWCYHVAGVKQDEGTNLVISSVQEAHKLPWNMAILIFVSTVLTHLCGGSAGREGAALQIGGSLGSDIARIFHMEDDDVKMIIMIGMAGVFSALFGTPLAAAIFSMEVIMVGMMNYTVFFPAVVCAATASVFAKHFGVTTIEWHVATIPNFNVAMAVRVGILAVLCSWIGYLFVKSIKMTGKLFAKYIPNQYLRTAAGGVIIVILTLICGTRMFNGVGMDTISLCMTAGHVVWYAFIMKILFTALTMGSGFKGGEIIPAFFIGATFGNVIAGVLGIDPAFAAAIGLISVFCSVVNCPMAATIFSIELFGSGGILYFALACAICYITSGYASLYATQETIFNKIPLKRKKDDEGEL